MQEFTAKCNSHVHVLYYRVSFRLQKDLDLNGFILFFFLFNFFLSCYEATKDNATIFHPSTLLCTVTHKKLQMYNNDRLIMVKSYTVIVHIVTCQVHPVLVKTGQMYSPFHF